MGMVLGFAREQPEVLFEEGQGGREGRAEAAPRDVLPAVRHREQHHAKFVA